MVVVAGLMIGIASLSVSGFQHSSNTVTAKSLTQVEGVQKNFSSIGFNEDVESGTGNNHTKPMLPPEMSDIVESGGNVLLVGQDGIENGTGDPTNASDVFTKALAMAKEGEGVYLKSGSYNIQSNDVFWTSPYKKYSNMVVRKNLTIVGQSQDSTTLVIDDSNSMIHKDGQDFAITFNAKNITLKNMTIKIKQDKIKSLNSVFNIWGNWDGSSSRGLTLENVRVEVSSPVSYLFYMNDYDVTLKNVSVKGNGNIRYMFYWNYGNIKMIDSKFDMSPTNGYGSGRVELVNTNFNLNSSDI